MPGTETLSLTLSPRACIKLPRYVHPTALLAPTAVAGHRTQVGARIHDAFSWDQVKELTRSRNLDIFFIFGRTIPEIFIYSKIKYIPAKGVTGDR